MTLLNEILDLSKIEAGKVEIECIEFGLRDVIESATQLFSPAAHAKQLEIVCQLQPSLPLRAMGDPSRIRQIIVNLIGNAIKFTAQGEVHIVARLSENGLLEVAVRDTGIGIAQEKQQAIFEAFQQEDSSTTRKYGGTGLGLSICQHLAQLMGGSIQLESVQGQGSTFSLCIPIQAVGAETQVDLADEQLRGHTALLLCSHPTTQAATQGVLEYLGLQVMLLASVHDLEHDMLDAIDLVVMDEPTTEATTKLKAWWPGDVLAMMRAGRQAPQELVVVNKPLCLEEVRELANEAIQGSTRLPAPQPVSPQRIDSKPTQEIKESPGIRVLVADDCDVNQEVARGVLEIEGFFVEVAGNGEEAINMLADSAFDVVLMDVEMPVMDGMQATRKIRKTSDVPVIALSAHAVEDLKRRCEDVGFTDFISKPFRPDELVRKIKEVLQQQTGSLKA